MKKLFTLLALCLATVFAVKAYETVYIYEVNRSFMIGSDQAWRIDLYGVDGNMYCFGFPSAGAEFVPENGKTYQYNDFVKFWCKVKDNNTNWLTMTSGITYRESRYEDGAVVIEALAIDGDGGAKNLSYRYQPMIATEVQLGQYKSSGTSCWQYKLIGQNGASYCFGFRDYGNGFVPENGRTYELSEMAAFGTYYTDDRLPVKRATFKETRYEDGSKRIDATLMEQYTGRVWALTCELPAPQIYTVFVESTGKLTYYYDEKKGSHTEGTVETYDPVNEPDKARFSGYNTKVTKAVIDPSMKNARLTSMRRMFSGSSYSEGYYPLVNLTAIEGLEMLNTENVTDMAFMFYGCEKLESFDISRFNTANVTNISHMFQLCSAITTLDVHNFDMKKIIYLNHMFTGCSALTTIYCNDDWGVGESLTDSRDMFTDCTKLKGGKGTIYSSMRVDGTYARPDGGYPNRGYFTTIGMPKEVYTVFMESAGRLTYYCDENKASHTEGIVKTYDPVNDPDKVRFEGYKEKVTTIVIHESMGDTLLTSMRKMFYELEKAATIEGLEYLNTSNVTDMYAMFAFCKALTILDLNSFNTANVTDMGYMFFFCTALKTIYCDDDWSTSAALQTSDNMFWACNALVGGNGTACNGGNATYARPDKDGQPGYFTRDEATGVESIQHSAVRSQKVLRNGILLIERNGKMYNAQGTVVR